MPTGTIIPSPIFTGFDANGDPLSGGKLHTYAAGTTTLQTTYSNVTLTSANTNPIVLDSAGRATIFTSPGSSFKYLLTDADDVTMWTADNILSVPESTANMEVTITAGEALAALDVAYINQGDGGLTTGKAYKTDADATYSSSSAVTVGLIPTAIAVDETGSMRLGGALGGYTGLTAGSTQYVSATAGALTESAPANSRIVGQSISTTSVMLSGSSATVAIDASDITSGTLAVARGGTGLATYTAGAVVYASATTVLSTLSADAGKFLKSGASAVSWDTVDFPTLSPLTTRGDLLCSSSGTVTGTRLGIGSADDVLTSDGTDVAWAAGGVKLASYPSVLADVGPSSTVETTFLTCTVSDAITNGSGIIIDLFVQWRTDSSSRTVQIDATYGGEEITLLTEGSNTGGTDYNLKWRLALIRKDRTGLTDLFYCGLDIGPSSADASWETSSMGYFDDPDFTAGQTLTLKGTLSNSNSDTRLRPKAAKVTFVGV